MTNGLNRSEIDYLYEAERLTGRVGYTLNIVTGCWHWDKTKWPGVCNIPCYARQLVCEGRLKGNPAYPFGFEPTFHPERIQAIGGPPKLIFLNNMGDMGGDWDWSFPDGSGRCNPAHIAGRMVDFALLNLQHILVILTKNPEFYALVEWPENVWSGATATHRHEQITRARELSLAGRDGRIKHYWMSLEPWMDSEPPMVPDDDIWLVIGGLTEKGRTVRPVSNATLRWLLDKSIKAKRFTKRNAGPDWLDNPDIPYEYPREYPAAFEVR